MQILTKKSEIVDVCSKWAREGQDIALVPTMGYYHAGHESLMKHARERGDKVVVSLFVNPTQFGPNEDFDSYPRNLDNDASIARSLDVDVLFAPTVSEMYDAKHCTKVNVAGLGDVLCGKSRPTHFDGVCTVVLKLFMLTRAHVAIFGQKDWQQLSIIRQMVRDLNIPIDIIGRPIVREACGLALSSRNTNLTPEEREQAPYIYQGLRAAKSKFCIGDNCHGLVNMLEEYWATNLPLGKIDYISVVDARTLEPQEVLNNMSLLACAIRMSKARLIDNVLLF